ncbi:E3 ubiquitin-protein ligase ARIH2-like [Neoarius graeffei]|uniref:E3 ubiquitin-protein ligase ARIH2-like n=1 Tax=Neoarius graeffei TaxID=443677 RepID=UPI00298CCF53|nr:E3 ubiquitin-protein ligase ARIH2-like [Neoarius graeffei]
MGGTASSQDDPINKENPTSLQITMNSSSAEILPQPEEQGDRRKCPVCSSFLKPAVVPAGCTTSLLQCTRCSATPLCEHCLYPCPDGTCTNRSCPVISLLLTCDRVTDSLSEVCGCPLFRACPKCHNIMMHETGCMYMRCPQCKHKYCFICLRNREECEKDENNFRSLTCSAPTAARQRFQT